MHATVQILAEPSIRDAALPITVAQYHRLSADGIVPERTELLKGVIIEQRTKSPLHTFLIQRLAGWLAAAVPAGWFVRKAEPLTFTDSEPEPDLAVVAGSPGDYRQAHPAPATLVVEVAIATVGIDRAKADVYASAGVGEYWIVIPESRTVEVYREPSAAGYGRRVVMTAPDAVLEPEGLIASPVSLQQLFD